MVMIWERVGRHRIVECIGIVYSMYHVMTYGFQVGARPFHLDSAKVAGYVSSPGLEWIKHVRWNLLGSQRAILGLSRQVILVSSQSPP